MHEGGDAQIKLHKLFYILLTTSNWRCIKQYSIYNSLTVQKFNILIFIYFSKSYHLRLNAKYTVITLFLICCLQMENNYSARGWCVTEPTNWVCKRSGWRMVAWFQWRVRGMKLQLFFFLINPHISNIIFTL